MGRPLSATAVAIALAFSLLSSFAGLAAENKYTENFTTTQYEDTLNTTANWDTVAGELGLFPFALTLSGSYDTPDVAFGVAVAGDYAFVADYTSGLQVIDISDPTNPALLGTHNTPGGAMDVVVAGDYAYVADYNYGLRVIDISDPTNPAALGGYYTPDVAYGVAVSGDYAFVADTGSGLLVFDVSDPTGPTLLGSYDSPGTAYGVDVSGDYAFVADGSAGLQVIDISDPANPALLGTYDTPGVAHGVTVSGDYALVAGGTSGLQVIDISDPTNPTLLGSYNTPGESQSVVTSGDYAYVADSTPGLQVIDISDPTNPTRLGGYNSPGAAYAVAVAGDYAYVADGNAGLQVIRISVPLASPVLAGNVNPPGWIFSVEVAGDYAFVADLYNGLRVIDISDPTSPALAATYTTTSYAYGIAVSGDYAFLAYFQSGLVVIDISDPTNPTLAATHSTGSYAYDVTVAGDHAFVADRDSGLVVIDISDPTNPALAGTYNTLSNAFDVAVAGDYAFVRDGNNELRIIDISDPANPTLLGTFSSSWQFSGVTVLGDYAVLGGPYFQTVDISDPTNPSLIGYFLLPGSAEAVAVAGDYAYVADMGSGLQVIDISDPANPTPFASYDTPGNPVDVAVAGDHAFVADRESGLQVIRVFEHEVYPDDNIGRSLPVDAQDDTVFRVRLTTTQTDSIHWEVSADSGLNWQGILPASGWNRTDVPGVDLLWRSTLSWVAPGDDPAVTDLQLEWLVAAAMIQTVADVPDDQGGWVSAHFTRSAFDFADEAALPISSYGIWRRVDNPALVAALNSASSSPPEKNAASDAPQMSGIEVIEYQGETYVQSQANSTASAFPPGTWGLVTNVPALQQDNYIAFIPTVADSSASGTNQAVYAITAHTTTPSVWYVSPPDSGYSLDNIAPSVPTSLAVALNTGSGNQLTWDPCPDADFQYFNIYRSSDPNFVPSPSELVHSTVETSWTDPDYDGWSVYYKVTALDHADNESDPAEAGTITAVSEDAIPQSYRLYPNTPNPFNPTTSIRYDVPASGGVVTLHIYDVSGRLVRTLLDGPQTAGQKTVSWNGRDNRGRGVASGVYFYRLRAPGYQRTLKMVLVQ